MTLTVQAAEIDLKTAQAAFDTAQANFDKAFTASRSDGPRPFGYVPLSVSDARVARDAALATRNAAMDALRDAQNAAPRKTSAEADFAAAKGFGQP